MEYEKEKDRLTKLFRLYEETESENKRLKERTKEWQDWFDSNEELFSKLFSSADHLRQTKTSSIPESKLEEPKEPPKKSEKKEVKKKPKRKIRFKK